MAAVGFAGDAVLLALLVSELALQLLEALPAACVEIAGLQRLAHRAARLVGVAAVAEAAGAGERLNVLECGREALVGVDQAEFPHAGRVQHQRPGRQPDQLAVAGGVAPVRILLADRGGRHPLVAGQRVDEGRLADARRAHQHRRLGRLQMRGERLQPRAGDDRDGQHRRAERDALRLGDGGVGIGGEVGLGQHHHRLGAALPGGGQVALQPPGVEVGVQRGDQQRHVDVGGHHLLVRDRVGGLADEGGAPRQHGVDGRGAFVGPRGQRHPVADDREGARSRLVGEPAGDLGGELAEVGDDVVDSALLHEDAAGNEPTLGVGGEVMLELIAPAIGSDQRRSPRRSAWLEAPAGTGRARQSPRAQPRKAPRRAACSSTVISATLLSIIQRPSQG